MSTLRRAVVIVSVALNSACEPEVVDLMPPLVVDVAPAKPTVPVSSAFSVTFSEQMRFSRDLKEIVVIAPSAYVDDDFISDLRNPPLTAARQALSVAASVLVEDDLMTLTITPQAPLVEAQEYALVVSSDLRDNAGNPIVDETGRKAAFVHRFVTEDGAPQVIRSSLASLVPANLRHIYLAFDESLATLADLQVKLASDDGGATPQMSVSWRGDIKTLAIVLDANNGCATLTPTSEYLLSVEGGEDNDGKQMARFEQAFVVDDDCDESDVLILNIDTLALENDAQLAVLTSKPSTARIWFSQAGRENFDCDGQPCPIVGELVEEESPTAIGYAHSLTVPGLLIDTAYDVEIVVEDLVGRTRRAVSRFATQAFEPLAINEVLANPEGDDDKGEFVELINHSAQQSVHLAGFSLQIGDAQPCRLDLFEQLTIGPGEFLVLTQESFVTAFFPELSSSHVMAGALCETLINSTQSFVLLDGDGRPISSYTGYAHTTPVSGRSVERVLPTAPDEAASFCLSQGAPTPGAVNSATLLGCQQ